MYILEDKRYKLARQTQTKQNIKRICRGVGAVRGCPAKLVLLGGLWTLAVIAWATRHLLMGYGSDMQLAPVLDTLMVILLLSLTAALSLALLWAWGGPWQAGRVQDNLLRIGLVNEAGEPPTLLSVNRHPSNPDIQIYTFFSRGLPVSTWMDRADKIQSSLNGTITDLCYNNDNQNVQLSLAPPSVKLPNNILWTDSMDSPKNFELILGIGPAGPVTLDLSHTSHVLIGGSTGSGKTVLLKLLLRQAYVKGAKIYIADFKDGIDYLSDFWQTCCTFCENLDGLQEILNTFQNARKERGKLFKKYHCNNIDEYNAIRGSYPMHRMIFACDEAAELFDKTGKSKEDRQRLEAISNQFESLARVGRAYGIHLILATQRPDANVMPGQVKSNIDYRICGRADAILSEIILGSRMAADFIPKNAHGRFVLNDGHDDDITTATVFQAYRLSDRYR